MSIRLEAKIVGTDITGELLESPVWDARSRSIYCVDIKLSIIWCMNAINNNIRKFQTDFIPTAIFLTEDVDVILVASKAAIYKFNLILSSYTRWLQFPQEPTENRFNDGRLISADTLLLGSMDDCEELSTGSLYRINSKGDVETLFRGIGISNGVSVTNGSLLYTDSKVGWLRRYPWPLNERGFLGEVNAARLGGAPDGHCVDSLGNIWIAIWGGSKVAVLNMDLDERAHICMPLENITSVCIGSEESIGNFLWVTSARSGLKAGRLYMVTSERKEVPIGGPESSHVFVLN